MERHLTCLPSIVKEPVQRTGGRPAASDVFRFNPHWPVRLHQIVIPTNIKWYYIICIPIDCRLINNQVVGLQKERKATRMQMPAFLSEFVLELRPEVLPFYLLNRLTWSKFACKPKLVQSMELNAIRAPWTLILPLLERKVSPAYGKVITH